MGKKVRVATYCGHYGEKHCTEPATDIFKIEDPMESHPVVVVLCGWHTDWLVKSVTEGDARALGVSILEHRPMPEQMT